jgi:hypothetical protein
MAENYQKILERCRENSQITTRIVDDYLIYYAAAKAGLDNKMKQLLKPFRHVTKTLPASAVNLFKSEYIASQLFRQNGLLNKYIKYSDIRSLRPEDYEFLQQQLEHPWRFSYAVIMDNPAKDFYTMLDVFTFEEYLMYSPGISQTLADMPAKLWFNLIQFNGQCWQSYGVIQGFQSFSPEDIFFFATEIHPDIADGTEVMRKVEDNPWPFFMLVAGSRYPLVISAGHELIYLTATEEVASLPVDKLKKAFTVSWNKGVYKLESEAFSNMPHFAKAYYEESTQTLHRFAMTVHGFDALTTELLKKGIEVEIEPFIEVGPTMLNVTQDILRCKIELNPYEELFASAPSPEASDSIAKLNRLLAMALPFINEGKPLDIEKLAAEADFDPDTAKQILDQVMARMQELKGPHRR